MIDTAVIRDIPEKVLAGLADGTLTAYGGVIRNIKGQIVAHMQFHNAEAISAIEHSLTQLSGKMANLQVLQTATLAFQGLNLGVSIAGFAVVCHKLNNISIQISTMDAKIDQILQGQKQMQREFEHERRTRMMANIESLAMGIRTEDSVMISTAMVSLEEIARFYEHLFDDISREPRKVYLEAAEVNPVWINATAIRMVVAQVYAHRHQFAESLNILQNHRRWHQERLEVLEQPIKQKPVPIWLGYPEFQRNKEQWQTLVRTQRTVPESLEYQEQQYIFCKEKRISFDEYRSITSDNKPFAYIEIAA